MNESGWNHRSLGLEIVRLVRDNDSLSRAEIARRLLRSPATVGRSVDQLVRTGLLQEAPYNRRSEKGRPARPLVFHGGLNSILTVDLRSTEAYAAITDLNGNILSVSRRDLSRGEANRTLDELVGMLKDLIHSGGQFPPPAVVVIGAPSIVDEENGIIEWAPSLDWKDLPLKDILSQELQLCVVIENDVNLAALGEFWKGSGSSTRRNMVFVSIGSGIGAGIILDGRLYRGSTHAAGEVAYFITDVGLLHDHITRIGNLENRVGREGLIRMSQLVAQRYPASRLADLLKQSGDVETQSILRLAEEGDFAAAAVYKELVDILTIVVCNISVLIDPELIVLGGPNQWNWSRLIPAIQERIGDALLRPVQLVTSALGSNAVILGGCHAALEHLPIFGNKSKLSLPRGAC